MKSLLLQFLFISLSWVGVSSFQPSNNSGVSRVALRNMKKEDRNANGGWRMFNPLKELTDMMSSMDDVIDDFMGKRMGNGEVFYGQRKYKPSGRENTEGSYNGMGMSDKMRIDVARQRKEEYLAMKAAREERLRRERNN